MRSSWVNRDVPEDSCYEGKQKDVRPEVNEREPRLISLLPRPMNFEGKSSEPNEPRTDRKRPREILSRLPTRDSLLTPFSSPLLLRRSRIPYLSRSIPPPSVAVRISFGPLVSDGTNLRFYRGGDASSSGRNRKLSGKWIWSIAILHFHLSLANLTFFLLLYHPVYCVAFQ